MIMLILFHIVGPTLNSLFKQGFVVGYFVDSDVDGLILY